MIPFPAHRQEKASFVTSHLAQDARYALRRVWRERAFSAVVVVTLAISIGWTTAIFSVVDRALVRPLDYDAPEQLVHLWERREGTTMDRGELSAPELFDLRASRDVFADIAAYRQASYSLSVDGSAERVSAVAVSASFFRLLGVSPAIGRMFDSTEDAPGAPLTGLLSDDAWRSRFGAQTSVIGRTVMLDGSPATIVGVLPAKFRFVLATNAQLWVPMQLDASASDRTNRWIRAIARLRAGVTVERARAAFDAAIRRMAVEHPESTAGRAGNLVPLRTEMVGNNGPVLLALLLGVAALLLTGCANVAGLLVSRMAGRAPELAVRRALGAEPARVIGQSVIENLLLAFAGGALGVSVAWLALRVLLSQIPAALVAAFPFVATTALDGRMIVLALVVSLLTGLLCGVAPAIEASRHAPGELLRAGGRSMTARSRWRLVLVASQLALTFLLIACSSLLARSLGELFRADLGFRPDRLLTFGIALGGPRYQSASARAATFSEVERRLQDIPEIEAVAVGSVLPLEFGSAGNFVLAEDRGGADKPYARVRPVTRSYFDALGIPLRRGREFTAADTLATSGVIVSEALIREYASRGARLGAGLGLGDGIFRPIIGVVGDVRLAADQPPPPMIYFPLPLSEETSLRFAVRTRGDPAAATASVRRIVSAIDPELVVAAPRSMRDVIDSSRPVFFRRFPMLVTTVFSGVGILLGVIGLFGVMAHAVTERTREFGIRMALGASRFSVMRLSLRDGLVATAVGIVVGVALSIVAGRALSSLLYGVSSLDVVSYVATVVVVLVTALIASTIPVRRAVAIPPSTAMRESL